MNKKIVIRDIIIVILLGVLCVLLFHDCDRGDAGKEIKRELKKGITKSDTIKPKDTTYHFTDNQKKSTVTVKKKAKNVDPPAKKQTEWTGLSLDTTYTTVYNDTLEDDRVIIYNYDSIAGSRLKNHLSYKLKVPLIINNTRADTLEITTQKESGIHAGVNMGVGFAITPVGIYPAIFIGPGICISKIKVPFWLRLFKRKKKNEDGTNR
jgi:hypothetical protein